MSDPTSRPVTDPQAPRFAALAIGDLQGCLQPLERLLDHVAAADPQAAELPLWFVGDLVNRGPRSLETLRFVRALGDRAVSVLGNHDLHLLAVAAGVRGLHRSDTFDAILSAPDRHALIDWIRARPLAHFEHGHLLVHAGVLPQWTAADTVALAAEVQQALAGPDWIAFLREMYGNTPARWSPELRGAARLRLIVNALTRMRFITPDGQLEFGAKGDAADPPPGHVAWFDAPGRRTRDVTVVFGHWSTLGLVLRDDLVSTDTGCVWGGRLTAVRLPDRKPFQVDCPQAHKPG